MEQEKKWNEVPSLTAAASAMASMVCSGREFSSLFFFFCVTWAEQIALATRRDLWRIIYTCKRVCCALQYSIGILLCMVGSCVFVCVSVCCQAKTANKIR